MTTKQRHRSFQKPAIIKNGREPIELPAGKATRSVVELVIQQATQSDVVKIALGSFCEGRGLEGEWSLAIDVATVRLVPANGTSPS